MDFSLPLAMQVLERTPGTLRSLLDGLDPDWIMINEGQDTWSPYDIVGHLIHGETTDWIPRVQVILGEGDKHFTSFDRYAQFQESQGKTLNQLLDEFSILRTKNLKSLGAIHCTTETLRQTGIHPEFGPVSLSQLLSTWVAHDLSHLAQIARVMARQYSGAVGPWKAYLPILEPRQ